MNRWLIAIIVVMLACVPMLVLKPSPQRMLLDSDTREILTQIKARNSPLSWFGSDWPLHNHFYRPATVLTFEADQRLHGDDPAGYGLTNFLICFSCVWALFWFAKELTNSLPFATICASLFALWNVDLGPTLTPLAYLAAILIAVSGFLRHGLKLGLYIPGALTAIWVGAELTASVDLKLGVLGWLPGRTAAVMAFFALISLAAYARYERLHSDRKEPEITPLDLPATRMSVQQAPAKPPPWIWPAISLISLLAALASYEQAVMIPAALTVVSIIFRSRGHKVRWWFTGVAWAAFGAYLMVRHSVIPSTVSDYQAQQLRHGPSILLEICTDLFPATGGILGMKDTLAGGAMVFMTWVPYGILLAIAANIAAYIQAKKDASTTYGALAISVLIYLPMAWIKYFPHYQYLPMAVRSIFVVSLAGLAVNSLVSAASPQAVQAPKRLSPAPGSLPHR